MSTPALVRDAAAQTPTADGRWVLYTGDEVLVTVPGISPIDDDGDLQPIRAVFDLASLTAPARFVALQDHDNGERVGSWADLQITEAATAALHLIEITDPMQAEALEDVIRLRAEIASGVPLQVSVGVGPGPDGQWQRIPPGSSITVNGRTFTADTDPAAPPLIVLRGGVIEEASLLTFGADANTGRAAAHRTRKALPMTITAERLKNLQTAHAAKHHAKILALCAEGMTDEQIAGEVQKADQAELSARCAAAEEKAAQCQAALDALVAKPGEPCPCCGQMVPAAADPNATDPNAKAHAGRTKAIPHKAGGSEGNASDDPKTVTEGIIRLRAENPKLTALAARTVALKRWPAMAPG